MKKSQKNQINSENSPVYSVEKSDIIQQALDLLETQLRQKGQEFLSPKMTRNYLILKLAKEEREHFHVLYLDNQHRLIEDVRLFSGTLNASEVHPREVAKKALLLNAAAVIYAHNHPSGICEPSNSDIALTEKLKKALDLFSIQSLDHIIIGGTGYYSFAENGFI
jgi:DNA repair protein RadC